MGLYRSFRHFIPCSRVRWMYVLTTLLILVAVFRHFRYSTKYFVKPISRDERRKIVNLFEAFDRITQKFNLTYFLYGGTLVGSFRHHGLVPWDDDVDVMMNGSQKGEVRKYLTDFDENLGLYVSPDFSWKFYYKNSFSPEGKDFRWPYIDIFFFAEDMTHIWDEIPKFKAESMVPKAKVFPLTKRRFETLYVPAPCDPEYSLRFYDIEKCMNSRYSHKYEYWKPIYTWSSVNCRELVDRYSFVKHTKIDDGWNETLEFKNSVLQFEIVTYYC